MATCAMTSSTSGERSSPPRLGRIRRMGSSRGAVKVCSTGMMGASGFTQDKMACIRVSHKIRLNAHLSTVNTAASKAGRSEEHTSELQSLMRISYAVFCLKKKKKKEIKKLKHLKRQNR